MEPKKRPRDEDATGDQTISKRQFVPPAYNTLHSLPPIPQQSIAPSKSLIDDLMADFTEGEDEKIATETTALPSSFSANHGTSADFVKTKRTLHSIILPNAGPKPPASSLFRSARDLEDDAPILPFALAPTEEQQKADTPVSANSAIKSSTGNVSKDSRPLHVVPSKTTPTAAPPSPLPVFQTLSHSNSSLKGDIALAPTERPESVAQQQTFDFEEVEDEFEALLAAAKSKRDQQPIRQLHQPKVPGSFHPPAKASSSLFSTASRLPPSAPPQLSSSSLFQVASSINDSSPDSIGSLFQTASGMHTGSSLFQTASLMQGDELPPPMPHSPASDYSNEPLFQISSALRAQPSSGTSLFATASSIRGDGVARPNSSSNSVEIDPPSVQPWASMEGQDEEDEFEAFLKQAKKTQQSTFKPVVATKSIPTPKPNSKPSAPTGSAKTPSNANTNQQRKFNAPSVVNRAKLNHATSSVKFKGVGENQLSEEDKQDDEDLDALLDLLGDGEDGEIDSTPKQRVIPKLPQLASNRGKHPPIRTPPTHVSSDLDSSDLLLPSQPRQLSEEHQALIADFELDEEPITVPTTPKSTAANRRFYGTPSPSGSTAPSPVMRSGRPTRPTVRSSPFSLTGHQSMPIVTSTPTHIVSKSPAFARGPPTTSTDNSVTTPARVRQPFTSPTKLASREGEGDGENTNLAPKPKIVDYGRKSKSSGQSSGTEKRKKMMENALFNLYPTEEQLAMRKTLKQMSESEQHRVPRGLARTHLNAYKLRPDVIEMTSDTAADFKFQQLDGTGRMRTLGPEDMHRILLSEGANPKHLSMAWVKNHYRWIVWKLASMERSFPQDFANLYLMPERTLAQLKYRYEREINHAQRPALRKILEHDAAPSMHMVLVVTAVRHDGRPDPIKVTGDAFRDDKMAEEDATAQIPRGTAAVIEVSDGWYSVNAICDPYLTRLIQERKIFPGQKLHIFGASIVGNDHPTTPLEVTASTMLKLQVNGVRRAKWHETLGFHARVPLPAVRIASLKQGGGIAPRIDAIILRVYPLVISEEMVIPESDALENPLDPDAPSVVRFSRNSRGEDIALERYLRRKEDWIEKTTRRLTLEILREAKMGTSIPSKLSSDPGTSDNDSLGYLEGNPLSSKQQEKLTERLNEVIEAEAPWLDRQVSPVLRLLICDYPGPENSAGREAINYIAFHGADSLLTLSVAQKKALNSLGKAVLTLYNATEDSLSKFKEGQRIQTSFVSYKGDPYVAQPKPPQSNVAVTIEDPFSVQEPDEVVATPLPRLSTTTYSGFEFPSIKDDKICKTMADLFGRVATPFNALDFRTRLRDVVPPSHLSDLESQLIFERRKLIDRFTVSHEFDGVGLVASVSAKILVKRANISKDSMLNSLKDEYQMDIYLVDESCQLLVVRVQSIEDNLPPKFELGSVLGFRNLLYNGFDAHVSAHSASISETTEWLTKQAVPAYLQTARRALLTWKEGDQFLEDMELISSRIFEIQTSAASRAIPTADLTNALFKR